MRRRSFGCFWAVIISLLLPAAGAEAVSLDLSVIPSNGEINGALFSRTDQTGQGTGNFESFLRIQANTSESGYNTDGALEFDTKSGIWTHSIKISDIPLLNFNGIDYREILLDAGEQGPLGGTNNQLRIDVLDMYLLNAANITGYPANFPVADRKYTLAGDDQWDSIMLNNIVGNGVSDMFILIPDSYFTGPNEYFYLYSELSLSGGTFEEFGVQVGTDSTAVPEPTSLMLFGGGLAGAFLRRRRA
ncbi:MAG: PEP-CTERM sorting domain-containing protein [Candidatus Omnitrophica bacterium]|nr:PEP-CTERM sorting domain-containing protein [Candidatus Omnitrophota bacterium]MCB9721421.1 PEP-CTERM sorting domain-containing protein [Candidatus Omnitrophota bacterium]